MGILSILLLTLAATADSFTIGLNYGVKQVRIGNVSNLFISGVCLLGTFLAMLAGRMLGDAIPPGLADLVGSAALLGFGAYMLLRALIPARKPTYANDPAAVDKDNSKVIELRESAAVGVLLALNNMGLGIGAGLAGVSVLMTPPLCALCSFLFIGAGCRIGARLSAGGFSRALELLSALLVLALGMIGLL